MTSPFDSPPVTRGEADNRYLSFTTPQTLTPDQQVQLQANLGGFIGVGGGGGSVVTVESDPDGSPVLVITTA